MIPISDHHRISDAHIVPRAAGGSMATLACTSCNSTFGHTQDKWLGEYLRLKNSKSSILHTRHQKGHFCVGGQKVGGTFGVTPEGGLDFFININRTNPSALQEVERQAAAGILSEVTIAFPLLENKELIKFGAITSAYLLWFRELGYSWALQRHLDIIRDLILHPMTATLPNSIVVSTKKAFEHPWIGVGRIRGELCLLTGLGDHIILFPTADRHDLYSRLPTDVSGSTMDQYQVLGFYSHHQFDAPLGVMYHDRVIICPDILLTGAVEPRFLLFPPDGSPPRMVFPISEEEAEQLKARPDTVRIKSRERLILPDSETGRSG
ncbi:MAG: HNH endonuclease [Sulfuricella sp.]